MNQILVTKKLYVTPELKRRKKLYKINFMISIFVIIILTSFYIYAEYDKTKNEEIGEEILSNMVIIDENVVDDTMISAEDKVWKITLTAEDDETQEETGTELTENEQYGTYTASNGNTYKTIGRIRIPKIDVDYYILNETSVELLKISPCKFWGPNPNEVGNLCIAGHNYRNKRFFSKVPTLVVGDVIEITDLTGRTMKYAVYDKYVVDPEDTSCTTQLTNGKTILTLITCTDDSKQRVIVQAQAII